MFMNKEFYLDGINLSTGLADPELAIGTRAYINTFNSEGAMAVLKKHPKAYKMIAESDVPVAISLYEEFTPEMGENPSQFACMEARHDGTAQIRLIFPKRVSERWLLCFFQHELVHAQDLRDGRYTLTGLHTVQWDGVEHDLMAPPMPKWIKPWAQYVKDTIYLAKYASQPWEARANAHMWDIVSPGFGKLVSRYGTPWRKEWDEAAIREYMLTNGAGLGEAIEAVVEGSPRKGLWFNVRRWVMARL